MKEVIQRSKFRCYLTKDQIYLFDRTVGCTRFIWNNRLNDFNKKDNSIKEKSIKELKQEYIFLNEVPYNALEQLILDWNITKKQYFNKNRKVKLGKPKFKSKKDSNQSFRVSYNGFSLKKGYLSISKFNKIKVKRLNKILLLHKITSCTLIKSASGKFYVSFVHSSLKNEKEKTGESIGIDLGLSHFIIDSQGNKIENPRFYRKYENKLKILQRHLSKKVKGSNRYLKCKKKIALLHEKISNRRTNFLHNTVNSIIDSYDKIYIEDLSIKNMVKNRKLSKSISDASWSKFISILEYKSNWYGKELYKINRYFASSKTCSECGYQIDKLDLSIREWTCLACDTCHDRDINAAKNILQRGIFEEEHKMRMSKSHL